MNYYNLSFSPITKKQRQYNIDIEIYLSIMLFYIKNLNL